MNKQFHAGARLKQARKEKGWSQEMLIGDPRFPQIDVRTLGRWEKSGIPPQYLERIAEIFELAPWVFTDNRITAEELGQLVNDPSRQTEIKEKLANQEQQQTEAEESFHKQNRFVGNKYKFQYWFWLAVGMLSISLFTINTEKINFQGTFDFFTDRSDKSHSETNSFFMVRRFFTEMGGVDNVHSTTSSTLTPPTSTPFSDFDQDSLLIESVLEPKTFQTLDCLPLQSDKALVQNLDHQLKTVALHLVDLEDSTSNGKRIKERVITLLRQPPDKDKFNAIGQLIYHICVVLIQKKISIEEQGRRLENLADLVLNRWRRKKIKETKTTRLGN